MVRSRRPLARSLPSAAPVGRLRCGNSGGAMAGQNPPTREPPPPSKYEAPSRRPSYETGGVDPHHILPRHNSGSPPHHLQKDKKPARGKSFAQRKYNPTTQPAENTIKWNRQLPRDIRHTKTHTSIAAPGTPRGCGPSIPRVDKRNFAGHSNWCHRRTSHY